MIDMQITRDILENIDIAPTCRSGTRYYVYSFPLMFMLPRLNSFGYTSLHDHATKLGCLAPHHSYIYNATVRQCHCGALR